MRQKDKTIDWEIYMLRWYYSIYLLIFSLFKFDIKTQIKKIKLKMQQIVVAYNSMQ